MQDVGNVIAAVEFFLPDFPDHLLIKDMQDGLDDLINPAFKACDIQGCGITVFLEDEDGWVMMQREGDLVRVQLVQHSLRKVYWCDCLPGNLLNRMTFILEGKDAHGLHSR